MQHFKAIPAPRFHFFHLPKGVAYLGAKFPAPLGAPPMKEVAKMQLGVVFNTLVYDSDCTEVITPGTAPTKGSVLEVKLPS